MNELSTHIEYLLLSHDCVVMPQFGAFVTMDAQASRSDGEQLFFPPQRRVRFNPDITTDDGLIVASLRQNCHLDEAQAKRRVHELVLELRQQLLADGQVDFGTIGLFVQDDDGNVSFSACQAGAVTPALYGLDAFSIPRVEQYNIGSRARRQAQTGRPAHHDSHIVIHISRRALRRALTAAAAVLLCVLCTVPLSDSTNGSAQRAAIVDTSLTPGSLTPGSLTPDPSPKGEGSSHHLTADEGVVSSVEPSVESSQVSTPLPLREGQGGGSTSSQVSTPLPLREGQGGGSTSSQVSTPLSSGRGAGGEAAGDKVAGGEAAGSAASPHGKFAIVLASATSEANAEAFVEKVKAMGYTNVRIYDNGRLRRVILEGYATESEALDAKHNLQWTHDGFDDAWMLRL